MRGHWTRTVEPTALKMLMPGKMGVELHLTPDASMAAGQLLIAMAHLADVQEERNRRLTATLIIVLAIALAVVLI